MKEDEQVQLYVQVQPNSRKNELVSFNEGVLQLKIAAPPVKGKANQELIRFLSDLLGVGRSSLTIKKGITSKRKLIYIAGLTQSQVTEAINRWYLFD